MALHENGISVEDAAGAARTGDIWIFRGASGADKAIRALTNSPVNHVGMAVVLEDLPPLLWHAEMGRSLPDMWTGTRHRGVQLHDLRDAVRVWAHRYGQRAWLRQISVDVTDTQEDALLRTIARLDGTPFPSTARLASRWFRGRVPRRPFRGSGGDSQSATWESAYCAQVVAHTYEQMGLLRGARDAGWYDPGRFWSGDRLPLVPGVELGEEIAVRVTSVDPADADDEARTRRGGRGDADGPAPS
ncbi:hypothetical protein [Tomitella fengzijianii]|uniref:hypothetical protein n=1 Tax=Tomitella fengzijianii TaxID=2597660 RepID=UPI001E3EC7AC|nr:hypothetical protein [Tomitella fengzijianii]